MKPILALPLLALALTSCETTTSPSPQPVNYRAVGNEPSWSLEFSHRLDFRDVSNNFRIVQDAPQPMMVGMSRVYRTSRIEATISPGPCQDNMSGRVFPETAVVVANGRRYRGCGAPIHFFNQGGGGPTPIPPPPPGINLTNTNWRVQAINGRRGDARDFMDFTRSDMNARFGCNNLGGSYSTRGSTLTVGPVRQTQMACPDMGRERDGTAILSRPMTMSGGGNSLSLSNGAGTIELRRR